MVRRRVWSRNLKNEEAIRGLWDYGFMVCVWHRYHRWNPAFPSSGLEGKNSRTLKRGAAGPPNYLGLSTKPHGVTSHDFILNKLKSPLHITCLGLIYMSTRIIELRIKFLKRYAESSSIHRTHGDVPLWTCPAMRIYSCCVFRCHINRRMWV